MAGVWGCGAGKGEVSESGLVGGLWLVQDLSVGAGMGGFWL